MKVFNLEDYLLDYNESPISRSTTTPATLSQISKIKMPKKADEKGLLPKNQTKLKS
jgi:hypothetical protein